MTTCNCGGKNQYEGDIRHYHWCDKENNKMEGQPLNKNIRIDIHKISEDAMVMVDENESKIEKATVLECGQEVNLVSKGDTILFKAYNLDTISIDGEKYDIIPEDDVKYVWYTGTNYIIHPKQSWFRKLFFTDLCTFITSRK